MFRNFYSANSSKEPFDPDIAVRRKAQKIGINPEAALYLQYVG